jgi:hypothetical protein
MSTKYSARILWFALFLPTLLIAAACSFVDDDRGAGGNSGGDRRTIVDAPIDGIDILVRESFPPQYAVAITSGLPSGCAQFNEAVITGRDGNTITISVTNTIPSDPEVACTAIYGTHESTVELGTDFESGETYTVDVNGETKEFTAQ